MDWKYEKWDFKAIACQNLQWMPLHSLMDILTNAEWIRFDSAIDINAKKNKLKVMTQQLRAIQTKAPFSVDERFPEGKVYIKLSHGNWPIKWSNLFSELCKLDCIGVYSAIAEVKILISRYEGLYCRQKFEKELGLSWVKLVSFDELEDLIWESIHGV